MLNNFLVYFSNNTQMIFSPAWHCAAQHVNRDRVINIEAENLKCLNEQTRNKQNNLIIEANKILKIYLLKKTKTI